MAVRLRGVLAAGVLGASTLAGGLAAAADLYHAGDWPALAADRRAKEVGDSLTVLIDETAVASNSTTNDAKKASHTGGQLTAGTTFNKSANLDLSHTFDGAGQTGRADKIVAQISVIVDRVLPNGDLHVTGVQALKINGERTNIRVSGRVRPSDIARDNSVPSTRLADASIDYDGAGFASSSAKAGLITRLLNKIGLP
jgi:flagellar L-ring protein precursor FlgH